MRITLLAAPMLALMTSTATAQTSYVGPWQPRPTIGVALGAFDDVLRRNNHTNLLLSGTFEFPFSDTARLRVEGGRSPIRLPTTTDPAVDRFAGTAHVSRMTISLAGLARPGAEASGYGGVGIGFYRLTHPTVKMPLRAGLYAHGGAEVPVSNSVNLDFELGAHLLDNFVRVKSVLLAEVVIRVKVGL